MQKLRNWTYHKLRWSERFTKTDMVYLAKGGFWLNTSQMIASIIGFTLSVAFANLLDPSVYGQYKYILSVGSIVGILSLTGLSSAVARAVAKGAEGVLIRSFWLSIKWNLIIVFVSGVGALYYFLNGNNTLASGLLIIGTLSPFIDSASLYNSFLSGKKHFRSSGLMRIARSAVTSLAILITLFLTENVIFIVGAYFASHAFITIGLFYYTLKKYRPNNQLDPDAMRLAKHNTFMNGLATFSDTIDNVLVFHYLGAVPLAIYNFARVIPDNLSGILKNFGTLAMPKFASGDKTAIKHSLLRKSFYVFIIGLFLFTAYLFMSSTIFQWLFPKYLNSIYFSQIYALILLFSAILPMAFLESQVAIKERYELSLVTNVLKLVLIFVGVVYYGIIGVIFARIISKMIGLLYIFLLIKRV